MRRVAKWENLIRCRVPALRAEARGPASGEGNYGVVGGKEVVASLPADLPLAVQGLLIWTAIHFIASSR